MKRRTLKDKTESKEEGSINLRQSLCAIVATHCYWLGLGT